MAASVALILVWALFEPPRLSTLEAVVRLGSFASAGEELGFTQSAVSQQIATLERQAGLRVLERRPAPRVTSKPTTPRDAALKALAGQGERAREVGIIRCW